MSNTETPWWKRGVFYQIYPRSYMDSKDNGVGDLAGITDRLEYVSKLGIDGIWISPFFASPMKDFGYDVSDYRSVDPMFGTNEDFDILLNRAHDLGMKVIIDMVLSHTSIEHPWFNESRLSADNRKADWYVWADPKPDGTPPNNWQSVFGGASWTFDTKRGQYYLHNFLKDQPDLNFHSDAVQKQMLSELEYWLERGVDGFRFDVCNYYFHDEKLRDNPAMIGENEFTGIQVTAPYPYVMQQHKYDKSQPENLDFLEKVRALMDKYPDAMTLAEIGDDNPFKRIDDYTSEKEKRLNTAYTTDLMSAYKIDTSTISRLFQLIDEQASNSWASWAFTNHDTQRVVTRWGKDIKDKNVFAVLMNKLLLSLRGTPFLYQGDELGLPEAQIPFEKMKDPWGIAMWPEWQGRDGCRTPMPWNSDKPHAGFSTSNVNETWLPIPHEHIVRAVNVQENDDNSVLNQTRRFIEWRKTQPILQIGDIKFEEPNNSKLIVFNRSLDGQTMKCIFNLSEETQNFDGKEISGLKAIFE